MENTTSRSLHAVEQNSERSVSGRCMISWVRELTSVNMIECKEDNDDEE